MRAGARAAAALLGASLALSAGEARAHSRSLSYSTWQLEPGGASVRARLPRLELTRLGWDPLASPGDAAAVGRLLAEQLSLADGAQPCPALAAPSSLPAPEGWVAYAWRVRCPAAGPAEPRARSLSSRLFLAVAPSHLHFTRVELPGGEVRDRVLSLSEPRWLLPSSPPELASAGRGVGASLASYGRLGVEHILTGWDHLAFVCALLLLASSARELVGLVSAFTLAHSVTLALATLGLVRPAPAGVEALIGFSILLVAAENAWILSRRDRSIPLAVTGALLVFAALGAGAVSRGALLGLALFSACHFGLLQLSPRPARLRAAVAFAFGLVHGFGFAGVLAELSLPRERLAAALFGFNAGVELGQLGAVACLWPALRALSRPRPRGLGQVVAEAGSAAICGLGVFWFVTRALS